MTGKTIISPNPVKTSERLDFNGNIIDPRTRQIIVPKEEETLTQAPPPQPPDKPVTSSAPQDDPIDIQTAIQQAEAKVTELKEAKKKKIKEMEEELNKLKE